MRPAAAACAVACVVALGLLAGCRDRGWSRPEVSHDLVEVVQGKLVIRTGSVGHDKWKSETTYALVEARSHADRDLEITLGGTLTAGGRVVGKLRKESIRVPAGGSRVFALVDDQQAARPEADGAAVEVLGAMPVAYDPPAVITDGNVYRDQNRAVVAGNVLNTADRPGSFLVIAAFFDAKGVPMSRPSTLFALDGKGKRGVQMVGPDGSESASLYVGEVSY